MTVQSARTNGGFSLHVGQTVPVDQWNQHDPPHKRLKQPCVVVQIETQQRCESGIMVTFLDAHGAPHRLDANWLDPEKQPGQKPHGG